MEVHTRDFGVIQAQPEDIITFAAPIYGFEDLKEFIFLYQQDDSQIVWLQSVQEQDTCFLLVQPSALLVPYHPELTRNMKELLGEGDYWYGLIVVLKEDFTKSTVNLKSPVVVNLANRKGAQVILEGEYPVRHFLFEQGEEQNDLC